MVFPVVMYGCESWTLKKAECWRIDVFELWCWRRLESPLACKEFQPVHSEGDQPWGFFGRNDAKAKAPVLWPPHAKSWLIGKDSDAGRDWGQRRRGRQRMRWLDDITDLMDVSLSELPDEQGGPGMLRFMGSQRVGHDWATEMKWTELNWSNLTCTLLRKPRDWTY